MSPNHIPSTAIIEGVEYTKELSRAIECTLRQHHAHQLRRTQPNHEANPCRSRTSNTQPQNPPPPPPYCWGSPSSLMHLWPQAVRGCGDRGPAVDRAEAKGLTAGGVCKVECTRAREGAPPCSAPGPLDQARSVPASTHPRGAGEGWRLGPLRTDPASCAPPWRGCGPGAGACTRGQGTLPKPRPVHPDVGHWLWAPPLTLCELGNGTR